MRIRLAKKSIAGLVMPAFLLGLTGAAAGAASPVGASSPPAPTAASETVHVLEGSVPGGGQIHREWTCGAATPYVAGEGIGNLFPKVHLHLAFGLSGRVNALNIVPGPGYRVAKTARITVTNKTPIGLGYSAAVYCSGIENAWHV